MEYGSVVYLLILRSSTSIADYFPNLKVSLQLQEASSHFWAPAVFNDLGLDDSTD
jgi:hypothetical protein